MSRVAAERRGWSDDLLNPMRGGSTQKEVNEDEALNKLTNPAGGPNEHTARAPENTFDLDDGGDATMADAPHDIDIDAELARAKAEFNDPALQLKSMLPFLHDSAITDALNGRDVEGALIHLNVVSPPTRTLHGKLASGSGARITAHPPSSAESAAEFLKAKLGKVLQGSLYNSEEQLVALYQARNRDIQITVDALRDDYKMKFNWDNTAVSNDWRDWCDARVTPQAVSVVSTSLMDMHMLEEPKEYDYGKEAAFLSELINTSRIILHSGIDVPDLARRYRSQFPAILRKMTISYNTIFPTHWTEKWLMEGFSRWLRPVESTSDTPRNAATSQATAPDIERDTAGPQRMYTIHRYDQTD